VVPSFHEDPDILLYWVESFRAERPQQIVFVLDLAVLEAYVRFVALGDPIGDRARDAELAWAFRDLAERHGGWPVFHEASEARLPLYTELGLSAVTIAEEARIDLPDFSPELAAELGEAPSRARIETAVVPAAAVPAMLPLLADVFDGWAAAERRDRSLLVPAFDSDFTLRHDVVTARQRGRLVAFGSLVAGSDGADMALFPVHIRPEGRKAVLRALLLEAIAQARRRGCRWFDLGTAPLPAEPADSPMPGLMASRARAFRYGGFFGETEDVRSFKQRFQPVWRPRYLVCPGGIALPQMMQEAVLVAEGRTARRRPARSTGFPTFGLTLRK
jgi:phosphatidylglycerol lysyltransferase